VPRTIRFVSSGEASNAANDAAVPDAVEQRGLELPATQATTKIRQPPPDITG
jgi:hypothetical protein